MKDLTPLRLNKNECESYMNAKEAADYLRTTVGAIRNLVYRKQVVAYKPFGKLLFEKVHLDNWVKRRTVGGFYGY